MRLGGMKYILPMAYVGTKVIADHFRATFSRPMPRTNLACLDLTRYTVAANRAHMKQITQCHVARPVPRPFKPTRETHPMFNHTSNRPPMIKRNGGLRGSTATKWR